MKFNINKELFIPMWPTLKFSSLLGRGVVNGTSFPFSAKRKGFFYFGRNALWRACEYLCLNKGDKVLVPAYSNDLIHQVLKTRGVKVEYFDINKEMQVTVDILESKLGSDTKAVLIIHYFGWPQKNIDEIKNFCRAHSLFLIEDCALSPASFYRGRPLGSWGDVSIFSLKKYWSVPNGGLLVVNNQNLAKREIEVSVCSRWNTVVELGSLLMKQLFIKFRVLYVLFGGLFNISVMALNCKGVRVATGSSDFNLRYKDWSISNFSCKLLKAFDMRAIRDKRLANFRYLNQLLEVWCGKTVDKFFSIVSDDISPLCYPVVVSKGKKNAIVKALRKSGIGVGAWWVNQGRFQTEGRYPNSEYWRKNIITLPIHQSLGRKQMEFMAYTLNKFI